MRIRSRGYSQKSRRGQTEFSRVRCLRCQPLTDPRVLYDTRASFPIVTPLCNIAESNESRRRHTLCLVGDKTRSAVGKLVRISYDLLDFPRQYTLSFIFIEITSSTASRFASASRGWQPADLCATRLVPGMVMPLVSPPGSPNRVRTPL